MKHPLNSLKYPAWLRSSAAIAILMAAALPTVCAAAALPPTSSLQAAELAITNAEQARVADYASPELSRAREKLSAARIAVQQKDMTHAGYLAVESKTDADLASARAGMLKAQAVNAELQKNIDTLKQEMQRNTGATL